MEKSQKTAVNQNTKFQTIQQMFSSTHQTNGDIGGDILALKLSVRDDYEEDCPKNEYQLQRAYSRQCEEVKLLRKQLVSRDRRIQDLENLVSSLQAQVQVQRRLKSRNMLQRLMKHVALFGYASKEQERLTPIIPESPALKLQELIMFLPQI
ncbi:hypothetical protein M8J77_023639 [Diaphorina citri]|nr:hypothetical protein M8J77_023639 [Diaphorina citri]